VLNADEKSAPARRGLSEIVWAVVLLVSFLAILSWFDFIDVYHRNFFDTGFLVLADNLARIGFIFLLTWLVYAPGARVAAELLRGAQQTPLTPAESCVLGFGLGVGLWHVLLLVLGLAGLYYRPVMVGLAAVVLLASARHFGTVATAAARTLAMWAAELWHGEAVSGPVSILLISVAAIWLLLTRGLYPGGGHDYYTHYFYYLLQVLKDCSIAPNDVWYHYYYSKGSGLFFFGMLLTDPLAPSLATFCCVIVAAIAMAALAQRIAPRSLWPGCIAAIYLSCNLMSVVPDGGGEFQKDHELVSALIVLIACALCMARGPLSRPWLMMATSSGVAVAIVAQPIGVVLAIYFMVAALWAMLRRRFNSFWRYLGATAAVGGTIAAIFAVNFWQTGLMSDQALDLTLRFADTARLDRWGVLPQTILVAWIRDNYATVAPSSIWAIWAMLRDFTRFDRLEVFFAGPAVTLGLLMTSVFVSRFGRRTVVSEKTASAATEIEIAYTAHVGSLIAFLVVFSLFAGRSQHVSFQRSSTFFVPLLLLLGMAAGAWASSRLSPWWRQWRLDVVLPLFLLCGTAFFWAQDTEWRHRLRQVTENSVRFFVGDYSLAEAYSYQDASYTYGAINPHALGAWRHIDPGMPIWSTNVNSYCMVPGCWIESVLSFKLSGQLDEIVAGPPDKAKQLLQEVGINYFLVLDDVPLLDILPYSNLFAPDTIGRYLGVKWTDGTAFLLTWIGPGTTPITPEFLKIYKERLNQPEPQWFQFRRLASQIAAAMVSLREKNWGEPTDFAWRHDLQAPN